MYKSIFIPEKFVKVISILVPIIEVLIAFGLLLSIYFKLILKLGIFVMLCFTLYVSFIYLFSPDIPCTCGGIISTLTWVQHIIINFILLLVFVIADLIKLDKII